MAEPHPSTVLREAAKTLRTLAEGTKPTPWTYDADYGHVARPFDPNSIEVAYDVTNDADGRWIAAMSPALAEPLAAWLEEVAASASLYPARWVESSVASPELAEHMADFYERHYGRALAVARVVLAANDTTRSEQ